MEHNGFKASLKKAPRLIGEHTFGLPSGENIPVFPVDAFLEAPYEWVKGPGSYVCPIESEWGLWFDWRGNNKMNTAILPSVKGMNPINGRKIEDLALERYKKTCPTHGTDFLGNDRLCEQCGWSWPPQNYVCAPNALWWDGFRADDGTVRQFFFSKEEEADIASAVIGSHNVAPAFGFCFYKPKKEYVINPPPVTYNTGYYGYSGFSGHSGLSGVSGYSGSVGNVGTSGYSGDIGISSCSGVSGPRGWSGSSGSSGASGWNPSGWSGIRGDEEEIKSVSVGAGAKINQTLMSDSRKSIDEWENEYSGIIRLYFCFRPQFTKILRGGTRDLKGNKEGFLKGLRVG